MQDTVNLTEVNDLIYSDTNLTYPCVIITGLETMSEYTFFHGREIDDPELCIPAFFECEGEMTEIGMFPMTLDFLLTVRGIGDYGITLCTDADTKKEIDLNDAETLMKFIKL